MARDASDALLRRCQAGDSAALDDLVRLHRERLFRLARRVCGDDLLAEEATADAFVRIWLRAGQWKGQASAATWLTRVAIHAVLDAVRRRQRWWRRWLGLGSAAPADPTPPADQLLSQAEEQQRDVARVQAALAQLAPPDRLILHLAYFEARDHAEIAELLDSNRDAVKTRLARARQRLRTILEK